MGTELEDVDSSSSIGASVNAFCSSSLGSKINWWRKSGGRMPECFELRRLELCVVILFIEADSLRGASSLAGAAGCIRGTTGDCGSIMGSSSDLSCPAKNGTEQL